MEYRRFDNTIFMRINRGEEILSQIKEVALKENIKLASVNAIGATNNFTVGLYDIVNGQFYVNKGTGSFGYELENGTYVAPK